MDLTELIEAVRQPGDDTLNPQGLCSRSRSGSGRLVTAPSGIVQFEPAEMTVRCGAGTPLDVLHAVVANAGQELALPEGGTLGGAIAIGRSDILRRGRGPIRDTVLQVRFITAAGVVVTAGGPTVKNVSGFDLCRVLVGSHGTLGVFGDIIIRTRVRPAIRLWFRRNAPPDVVVPKLARPVSVLWDGSTCWVCLEGHPHDVADEQRRADLVETETPPELPTGARWSIAPRRWRELDGSGRYIVELGVGVVHHERKADPTRDPVTAVSPRVRELGERLRRQFDPTRRLNPHLEVFPR